MSFIFLYKFGEQEGRIGPDWGKAIPVRGEKRWGKGVRE
jgi:hypothetical protein